MNQTSCRMTHHHRSPNAPNVKAQESPRVLRLGFSSPTTTTGHVRQRDTDTTQPPVVTPTRTATHARTRDLHHEKPPLPPRERGRERDHPLRRGRFHEIRHTTAEIHYAAAHRAPPRHRYLRGGGGGAPAPRPQNRER
jgi:hypothetical protein